MEAILISKEHYQTLQRDIDEIKGKLMEISKDPKKDFLDNSEFVKLMKISKRTAQSWRDENLITFSQVGNKIYYRMDDIQNLLERNVRGTLLNKLR